MSSLPSADRRIDAVLSLRAPNGEIASYAVEVKARFEPRHVDTIIANLRRAWPNGQHILVAPFLSPRSRERLREERICYADLTGNIYIVATDPAIFIAHHGSDKDLAPSKHPRTSLRGPITGRIVRFLCQHAPPFRVREIATATNVNPGNISRILDFIDRESFLEKDLTGTVTSVDWAGLLRRWAVDLVLERHETTFLEPRGIDHTLKQLTSALFPCAITGQYAGWTLTHIAPPVAVDIYVWRIDEAREELGLRASEHIGNVRLIQAFDRVVFEGTLKKDGLEFVNASQVVADLLTLPHRSSEESDALLSWMKDHENVWRVP